MAAVIEWKIYSFELPLVTGGIRKGLAVQLSDGWGEVAPYPGRSQETIDQAIEQLLRVLSGEEEKLLPSVQFGLESALSHFQPVKAPLYAFLNGSVEEILRRAEASFAQGYRTAKVKISTLSVDAAIGLLNRLKDRFRLRVDCNNAFSFRDAVSIFSRFEPSVFDYIEDPTRETSRLAEFPYPFALDETISSLPIDTYPQLYGFILKPTVLGGKKGCAPFIQLAKKHNLKVVFSPVFESGLGLLQILNVASHFGLLSEPIGLDTHRYLAQDVLLPSINFNTPIISVESPPEVNPSILQEIAHGKCQLPHF